MGYLVGIDIKGELIICGRFRCNGRLDADAELFRPIVSLNRKSKGLDTDHGTSGEPFNL